MNRIRTIRARLGITQEELAAGIGCTRSNVSAYECSEGAAVVTPFIACRLISFASSLGVKLTYNQIYGDDELPPPRILARREEVKA